MVDQDTQEGNNIHERRVHRGELLPDEVGGRLRLLRGEKGEQGSLDECPLGGAPLLTGLP